NEIRKSPYGRSSKAHSNFNGGIGGMGGAQPLAVTMNEGVVISVEVDEARIQKRLETKYCDVMTTSIDEAIQWAKEAKEKEKPLSIALLGNAADVHHTLLEKDIKIDVVTDQTSAHDPLNGYIPKGYTIAEANGLRKS